mmetsp:Transcript_30554/g.74977  ORF Transcript_30554/g.74977 Transcript_30554/m.74977 type:complete len:326 (+) Transcript_30554:136-1113(+)
MSAYQQDFNTSERPPLDDTRPGEGEWGQQGLLMRMLQAQRMQQEAAQAATQFPSAAMPRHTQAVLGMARPATPFYPDFCREAHPLQQQGMSRNHPGMGAFDAADPRELRAGGRPAQRQAAEPFLGGAAGWGESSLEREARNMWMFISAGGRGPAGGRYPSPLRSYGPSSTSFEEERTNSDFLFMQATGQSSASSSGRWSSSNNSGAATAFRSPSASLHSCTSSTFGSSLNTVPTEGEEAPEAQPSNKRKSRDWEPREAKRAGRFATSLDEFAAGSEGPAAAPPLEVVMRATKAPKAGKIVVQDAGDDEDLCLGPGECGTRSRVVN